jgi:hypothetical protein
VFHQGLARVHAGDVGQGEVTQIGKFGEGRFLEGGVIRERVRNAVGRELPEER